MVSGDPLNGLLWPEEKISPWSCSEQILGHRARLKAQDGYKRSHGLQLLTSGLVVFFFFFPFFMVQNIFAHVLNYSTAIAEFTIWTRLRGKEGFPGGSGGKEPACRAGDEGRSEFEPWVGKIPWRRAWQPTAAFLPGESHAQRSLVSYTPQDCKKLDTTEVTEHAHTVVKNLPVMQET